LIGRSFENRPKGSIATVLDSPVRRNADCPQPLNSHSRFLRRRDEIARLEEELTTRRRRVRDRLRSLADEPADARS
jgi:hypothetical protein